MLFVIQITTLSFWYTIFFKLAYCAMGSGYPWAYKPYGFYMLPACNSSKRSFLVSSPSMNCEQFAASFLQHKSILNRLLDALKNSHFTSDWNWDRFRHGCHWNRECYFIQHLSNKQHKFVCLQTRSKTAVMILIKFTWKVFFWRENNLARFHIWENS